MDALIVRAANMFACRADERDVRAMLLAEVDGDEGLAFLLFTAGRLLASSS